MAIYPVKPGVAYFAGITLPFFVSSAAVVEAARERGFTQVIVTPRNRARFAFDVRKVPGYSEDWDHAFFGIYEGRTPTISVPENPAWLFEVKQQIPPPGKNVVAQVVAPARPGVPARKPAGTGAQLAMVLTGGIAVWIFWATLQPVERHG